METSRYALPESEHEGTGRRSDLRVWTAVILRTVLAAAGSVLIAGLIAVRLTQGQYLMHFRAVQHNAGVKDYLTFEHR